MCAHKMHVLSVHRISQRKGRAGGKRRIGKQKEKRVQGAMKSRNSKRKFLLSIGRENKQRSWKAPEREPRT